MTAKKKTIALAGGKFDGAFIYHNALDPVPDVIWVRHTMSDGRASWMPVRSSLFRHCYRFSGLCFRFDPNPVRQLGDFTSLMDE